MEQPTNITSFAIYPTIGLSRVGNSSSYFLTSDIPGVAPQPKGGFKDENGNVKKQVARFRIYGLDENGNVVKEITADSNSNIAWRVHMANRKGAWYNYDMPMDLPKAKPVAQRNQDIKNRTTLVIDGGVKTISGINQKGPKYEITGQFLNFPLISLGFLRTDEMGRLLVFGGTGEAKALPGAGVSSPTDDDGWYDTTADGTIRATITYQGKTFEATPSVVIVAPPNFAPGLFGPITGLDLVNDLYVTNNWIPEKEVPSFSKDIYPIFQRLNQLQWASSAAFMLFGIGANTDFGSPEMIQKLADRSEQNKAWRADILSWFRQPDSSSIEVQLQLPYYGDTMELSMNSTDPQPSQNLALLPLQYRYLQKWAAGNFEDDTINVHHPLPDFESLSPQAQTVALNEAVLTECLGGPFVPGIEITWIYRVITMWAAPFRLNIFPEDTTIKDNYGVALTPEEAMHSKGIIGGAGPGTLTRWMGVPWQADSTGCRSSMNSPVYLPLPMFWTARVPTEVLSQSSYTFMKTPNQSETQISKYFGYRQSWFRGMDASFQSQASNMVDHWFQQGIVQNLPTPIKGLLDYPQDLFMVEQERTDGPEVDFTIQMMEKSLTLGAKETSDEKKSQPANKKILVKKNVLKSKSKTKRT